MNKFAERFKELRLEKGLAQKELAKLLGVARSAVCYWETGQRIPGFDYAVKIAQFFNVSLDYLAGLEY